MITLDCLNNVDTVRHGFFTREGGVSTGVYASLNCGFGSNDQPALVGENRARVATRLGVALDRLLTVYQIHSAKVVTVDQPWRVGQAPEADAMVTDRPGVALGILTADCVPVLLSDTHKRIIGAAHAGWKGTHAGVIEATIAAMVHLGARPEHIVAGIGPCIAQRSYEVGPDFPAHFTASTPSDAVFFSPSLRAGHFMFDLAGLVARRIGSCGVPVIRHCPHDTLSETDRFFSYRRATLRGETDYGRNISAIVLQE